MKYKIIAIGCSLGGLKALQTILGKLNEKFYLPLIIIQHREINADLTLKYLLENYSKMNVIEPEDKDEIKTGTIYLAPAGYHLLVNKNHFELSADEPVNYSKPSIDVAFESIAESFQEKAIGIILTGANKDGAIGLQTLKYFGGFTIVQNPDTAESRIMPDEAIALSQVDKILSLEEIADFLNEVGKN